MKLLKLIILIVGPVIFIEGCNSSKESDHVRPDKLPVNYTIVNGDENDIEVPRSFAWDIHVDGKFNFEENYFLNDENRFSLDLKRFKAEYLGNGIFYSRVNDDPMCTSNTCETTEIDASGVWQKLGMVRADKSLTWDFINKLNEDGFRVEIKDAPEPITILDHPETLSTVSENTIFFKPNSEKDSVLFEIVIVPKTSFGENPPLGTLFTKLRFPAKAENGKFVILGDELLNPDGSSIVARSDSAFINLVSIRRRFKIIDDKIIAINHSVNHLKPILIR